MRRLSHFLVALALALCLPTAAALLAACSDEQDGGGGTAVPTLAEELATAGLPPGPWRVENGGNSVCIRTFTAPGNITSTESIGLSGFGTFALAVGESDALTLQGTSDTLGVRWTAETQCLEYDAAVDTVTHQVQCGDEELGCPPFSLVRLCANEGAPTFFARVPECGQSTFPAVAEGAPQ